jgi:hypothetical protein
MEPSEDPQHVLAPLGSVEPHAGLLKGPDQDQLLYKVMKVEHLIASVREKYLHFNRVDGYADFPGADPHDGQQLPTDQYRNAASRFEKAPEFSAADYYDQSRRRTYACSFSLENSAVIWANYANGSKRGKACVEFHFGRLRTMLNHTFANGNAALQYRGQLCRQIFSLNYGIVDYVDWTRHQATEKHLPNPIQYTYLKSDSYSGEREMRISLSAIGIGRFQLADGTELDFPKSLHVPLDFPAALNTGAITRLICDSEVTFEDLQGDLHQLHIDAVVRR